MKFYRNERIDEIAEQRLREFEGKLGVRFLSPSTSNFSETSYWDYRCYGKTSMNFPAKRSSPASALPIG